MASLRLTLIAPAVWLSGRLNFALKYWALGLGIALIGGYLSTPLFEHVNKNIAQARLQRDGLKLVTQHNNLFLRMLHLRGELGAQAGDQHQQRIDAISAEIDELLRTTSSSEEAKLAIVLGRAWERAKSSSKDEKLENQFASFNMAINALLALSRESARSYRLNLDAELDAAFDMLFNRLPLIIDILAKQDLVIHWGTDSMTNFAVSGQISLNENIPGLRNGVSQISQQIVLLKAQEDVAPGGDPAGKLSSDTELQPFDNQLLQLLGNVMLQQDAVDQVHDAIGAELKATKASLRSLAQSNVRAAQDLLSQTAAASQTILSTRIDRLYQDRMRLTLALIASGSLIAYLLYAFYIGVLRSINALSRGTNAFCAGQRDVRIKLKSRDELSLVATNFNTMAQEVERLVQTIEEQNQTRERDLKILVDALGVKNEELFAVNQRVHEELNLARSVQLAILPQQFPDEASWSAHACMHPARELGGDFYDCFPLPDGRFGVLVADVSGKGVGAAFFMAVSRTVLLDSALSVRTPSQVLAMANDLLCARNPMDLFVTACYGLFNPQDGTLVYASAGHHAPMLRRTDGKVEILSTTNDMALGVFGDMRYSEHHTQLALGESLMMYTDGVTEAFSRDDEAYGEHRLSQWFSSTAEQENAAQLVDALVSDVAQFVDGAEASDDLTCLILCRKQLPA